MANEYEQNGIQAAEKEFRELHAQIMDAIRDYMAEANSLIGAMNEFAAKNRDVLAAGTPGQQ